MNDQKTIPPLHVIVSFGSGIPSDVQGPAMLQFERSLRILTDNQLQVEVFKDRKPDDSKLRNMMTKDERAKL